MRRVRRGSMAVFVVLAMVVVVARDANAQQAGAGASASAQGRGKDSGAFGFCFNCDPYYYRTIWWWSVFASGGFGGSVNVSHAPLYFGRVGPVIGFGDGDFALMLQVDYDVSAQSQVAFGGGLWGIYHGTWWADAGAIFDFDGGRTHYGGRFALGYSLIGVEAQERSYGDTSLGQVLAVYAMLKVPYGLAQTLMHLPQLPGGGVLN